MRTLPRFVFTVWALFTFILLMLMAFAYHVIVMAVTGGRGIELIYKCYRPWARSWAYLNGVELDIKGYGNFDRNKSYVFVCNHGSTADIIIVVASMLNRYRPLGKKETTEIPVMGYIFRRALVLVNRSDPESRRKSMERMRELTRQNISVLIAAEGTRNRTELPLQPFKEGAFRLAIECRLPVVPMVLLNTRKLYPNNSWLMEHCALKCHFLKAVSTEGMTETDIPALKEKIFKIIEEEVIRHDALFENLPIETA